MKRNDTNTNHQGNGSLWKRLRNEKHRKALHIFYLFFFFSCRLFFTSDTIFNSLEEQKEKDDTFHDERMTIMHANESIRTRRKRDQSINPRSHIHLFSPHFDRNYA